MHFSRTIAASAVVLANGATALSGEATYYGGNVAGGACLFSTYTLPAGIFGTALSDSNWDTSANCGACVSVTGPDGNSITAMIVDECPGCGTNHLDLFPDAFSSLADAAKGVIPITWEYVDCPITSPLVVHNKEGVSAYWFSLQVVNANKAVSKLEVSTDGGSTWQSTTRQDYNFFENSSGYGTTTVDVKVTSVDGDVVIINNVNVAPGVSVTGPSNFGSGSSVASSAKNAAVVATTSSSAEAAPATTEAPATTSVPAAVFNEVSYSASSISDHSTTTSSSTTTITRTRTVPKSTSIPTPSSSSSSTYVPIVTYSPSNTTSALAAPTANSTVSISVLTITTCIPTVLYSLVPYPETSSTPAPISTGIVSLVQNITIPATTATPSTVFTGSASSLHSSAFIAAFAGVSALLFI